MPYGIDELQSGIRYLADAGEAGRRSLDGMIGPINGAVGEVTGAVGQLNDLPFVGPMIGGKLQRLMFRGGIRQLDTLRSIGGQLLPLDLTTGFGHVLGSWCLMQVGEDQSGLLQGAVARKQSFTREFSRYGDDLPHRNR